jgi:fucose 4-O-acetylase-like acetyltransferase
MSQTAPTTAPPANAPSAKPRVPFWDNARFVSILLVVMGHSVQKLSGDSDPAKVLYLAIYAFHMPAFAIISGYFSRSDAPTRERMQRLLTDIVIPYVIFETLWSIYTSIQHGTVNINLSTGSWTLWFLLALGLFRLILPYLALLRFPLVWAVAIALITGYYGNIDNTFALDRGLVILPFFVLGWQLKQWGLMERVLALGRAIWAVRAASFALFTALVTVIIVFLPYWKAIKVQHWMFYDRGYSDLGFNNGYAWAVRLGFMLLSATLTVAFLTLIPRSTTWVTPFGQATMYVYLLHTFVLYPVRDSGVLQGHGGLDYFFAMIFAAIAITVFLAAPFWRTLLHWIIEPKATWLFTPDTERTATSPAAKG